MSWPAFILFLITFVLFVIVIAATVKLTQVDLLEHGRLYRLDEDDNEDLRKVRDK